ncbi:MAG TPA: PQQ-binding-like beta-propeller repeat protein [Gemmatimonadales bacterium]|nr:PQQ-binding-like beta-propeller repeat protein [Gemmatimonadales bacterium]
MAGNRLKLLALGAAAAVATSCASPATPGADWRTTGGAPGNTRYSPLHQIDRANVAQLKVAWTYHSGDLPPDHSEIQATPIVVDGVLYTTTAKLAVVALRADQGTLLWRFDPFPSRRTQPHVNRGVVYWAEGKRVFFAVERRLYALDARTGKVIPTFGDSGWVDLGAGLERDINGTYIVSTSPGVVYKDVLVWGTRVGEEAGSAPGHVRAYDARTGQIRWTFHTIPFPTDSGNDTWPSGAYRQAGGANSWAGMTVDTARGVVFIPTGSATPDFYGGDRHGANLFASSLLALDALTGKRLWHFQTVHHDLWDRDLPAAPNLVTVTSGTKRVDAVAQITKSGFVFLFDRQSGQPLFPVAERPVPKSDLRGEETWPTQPFPLKPGPFARQSINESDVILSERRRFRRLRHGSLFTPPSREGTVVLPGFDGGGEWGGAAVDPQTGVLYVNGSDVPWIAAMREPAHAPALPGVSGAAVYAARCAGCHGADRRGRDPVPTLIDISKRMTRAQLEQLFQQGRGFMPPFASMPAEERCALIELLLAQSCRARSNVPTTALAVPTYEFVGYEKWRDARGLPAINPPWGTLSAIDLNTGDYVWRIPLGEHPALAGRVGPASGTEQYGGPIVTAGGLVFIAATLDAKFRAFDKATGRLLWETSLPAAGYATPCTFSVGGKQYVVVAAGGGKLGTPSGDVYVAFALP